MTTPLRKHVTPAHPAATIPDPERGRDLTAEGHSVAWTAYWAGLERRGDIVVTDVPDTPKPASEGTAIEPAPPEAGHAEPPPYA